MFLYLILLSKSEICQAKLCKSR
uniref:Uncharacterized protein n=1 Tax=Lepeophtheirus salmonis TaxID=72036 RepID=A0A0K2US54_LEPSM